MTESGAVILAERYKTTSIKRALTSAQVREYSSSIQYPVSAQESARGITIRHFQFGWCGRVRVCKGRNRAGDRAPPVVGSGIPLH